MPNKIAHPCNHPGCPALTTERFCPAHAKQVQQRYDKERGTATERGYDSTWAKVRKIQLSQYPLCQRCEQGGVIRAAVLVHHVKRIADGGSVLDQNNLLSVCADCHYELHKGDVWGRSK